MATQEQFLFGDTLNQIFSAAVVREKEQGKSQPHSMHTTFRLHSKSYSSKRNRTSFKTILPVSKPAISRHRWWNGRSKSTQPLAFSYS
ncbi:MAG: hypothetical protein LBC49_02835, partial [Bacteroidales bacterium]|nr:hypothetical protein [Bacteroidales bacterium]